MAIHMGVAAISKCPELALDQGDAKTLAEATAGVLALYKVRMTPKQEAYGLLIEAAAQVYPPMIFSIWMRKKMEMEAAKTAPKWPVKTVTPQPQPIRPAADPKAPTPPAPAQTGGMPDGFDPGNISIPK